MSGYHYLISLLMNQIVMARAHRLSGMYTYERAFNSAIDGLPLTNMRYRNGWVETVVLLSQ